MGWSITPLSPHTGAEVRGVDLKRGVDDATRARLNRAFVDHSVLVIRDQDLSPPGMLDAVRLFGDVFEQHNAKFSLPDCPLVHYISNKDFFPDGRRYIPGEGYHTDHSNAAEPPKATVLHAVELPDIGGDTQFVNMHRAYETLPDAIKTRVEGLKAVHVYQSRYSERKLMGLDPARREHVPDAVVHPIVRTHPESGRKALYLGGRRHSWIIGMEPAASDALLDALWRHAIQDRFVWTQEWRRGDMVMWDNRCVMHRRDAFDPATIRLMHRTAIEGERPV
jgi:taurine dioxygenase